MDMKNKHDNVLRPPLVGVGNHKNEKIFDIRKNTPGKAGPYNYIINNMLKGFSDLSCHPSSKFTDSEVVFYFLVTPVSGKMRPFFVIRNPR